MAIVDFKRIGDPLERHSAQNTSPPVPDMERLRPVDTSLAGPIPMDNWLDTTSPGGPTPMDSSVDTFPFVRLMAAFCR
jgi:hypothetical protein